MESSTPWWTMGACWREWTQLPGPLLASGVSVRGFEGEAETDALVRSATSSNKDEVLMMGGTMASRDAHASVSEVDCDAGGFEISKVPPEAHIFPRTHMRPPHSVWWELPRWLVLWSDHRGVEGGD